MCFANRLFCSTESRTNEFDWMQKVHRFIWFHQDSIKYWFLCQFYSILKQMFCKEMFSHKWWFKQKLSWTEQGISTIKPNRKRKCCYKFPILIIFWSSFNQDFTFCSQNHKTPFSLGDGLNAENKHTLIWVTNNFNIISKSNKVGHKKMSPKKKGVIKQNADI